MDVAENRTVIMLPDRRTFLKLAPAAALAGVAATRPAPPTNLADVTWPGLPSHAGHSIYGDYPYTAWFSPGLARLQNGDILFASCGMRWMLCNASYRFRPDHDAVRLPQKNSQDLAEIRAAGYERILARIDPPTPDNRVVLQSVNWPPLASGEIVRSAILIHECASDEFSVPLIFCGVGPTVLTGARVWLQFANSPA